MKRAPDPPAVRPVMHSFLSPIRPLGGAFRHRPEELPAGLGDDTRRLLDQALEGIDAARLCDYHAHVLGLGCGGTGAFVSQHMQSLRHPLKRLRFAVFASACGITDLSRGDEQFVARLRELVSHFPSHGRHVLLAFDRHYSAEGGAVVLDRTVLYTPNDYVAALAEQQPELFAAAVSVHPYREDALAALDRWAARGVRIVKWLPNTMGIDPADERCLPFYAKLSEHDLILLSHTGDEQAFGSEVQQQLGNPLRLRLPLEAGVKVIAAHCASLGDSEDLDHPGRARRANFDLLLRLFEEPRYEGRLYGDLSAMTQFNRLPRPLVTLLERRDLHHRLVNGSDYPLPAINLLIRTRKLVKAGLISEPERAAIAPLYHYNPLLFDFVLKRTVKAPGTTDRFPPAVFMQRPGLEPGRALSEPAAR